MKAIIVDLEMNRPVSGQGIGKIIQIGAVCVDLRACKEVDCFNMYVDPKESLSPEIVELTGITNAMTLAGHSYEEALDSFWLWVAAQRCRLVSAWGRDVDYLVCDAKDLGLTLPRMSKLDIKAMFQILRCGFPSSKSKGGLKSTLDLYGLEFQGRQHNALADARQTARLLVYAREMQYYMNLLGNHKRKDLV